MTNKLVRRGSGTKEMFHRDVWQSILCVLVSDAGGPPCITPLNTDLAMETEAQRRWAALRVIRSVNRRLRELINCWVDHVRGLLHVRFTCVRSVLTTRLGTTRGVSVCDKEYRVHNEGGILQRIAHQDWFVVVQESHKKCWLCYACVLHIPCVTTSRISVVKAGREVICFYCFLHRLQDVLLSRVYYNVRERLPLTFCHEK